MSDDNKLNDISDNKLGDMRNLLGFLLAGFGALLSFLGVRSSEVSTILRNDSVQASVVVVILLFGVLAAVSAIIIDSEKNKKKLPLASVVEMGIILLGLGALVIFAIPIGRNPFTISGWISLVIGCLSVFAGTLALVGSPPSWVEQGVGLIDVLILASVLFTAIAAYGAIRLESKSQLSFSSQVGASFTIDGPRTTVSLDIAATKIPQTDWVFIDVYGLPVGISMASSCAGVTQPKGIAPCTTDPCLYFTRQRYASLAQCAVLLNGSIVPNATGDVNETLSVPFLTANYQDIDVRAEVCSPEGCAGNLTGQNSRLDWIIFNSLNKSG